MAIELTGTIHMVNETVHVSDRFSKREFVLKHADNPKYEQLLLMQCTGDRCQLLDGLNVGDEVTVSLNLRGREWRSPQGEIKYFVTLEAWRVESGFGQQSRQTTKRGGKQKSAPSSGGASVPDDDIPFASCAVEHEPSPIAAALRR